MKDNVSIRNLQDTAEERYSRSETSLYMELEFERLREEQRSVANQILYWLGSDERGFESNLVAISALAIIVGFTLANKSYFIFLLASIPFHILIWSQVKRGILAVYLHNYLIDQIAPRMNRLVNVAGTQTNEELLRQRFKPWQETIAPLYNSMPSAVIMVLPHVGRFFLQFAIAAGLVIADLELSSSDSAYEASSVDRVLVIANYILILITSAVGVYSIASIRVPGRPPSVGKGPDAAKRGE